MDLTVKSARGVSPEATESIEHTDALLKYVIVDGSVLLIYGLFVVICYHLLSFYFCNFVIFQKKNDKAAKAECIRRTVAPAGLTDRRTL